MTSDALRLELADQRVRLAELEGEVAQLRVIVTHSIFQREVREAERRERELATRYGAIRELVAFFPARPIEAQGRAVRRVCSGMAPAPDGSERHVRRLRQFYGDDGPDTRTVRRALTKLTDGCGNETAAENQGDF